MKMRLRTATPFPKDASARPLGKKADVGWKGCRPRLAVRARHIRRGGLDGVCQLNGAFGDLAGAGSEVLGALLADKNESRGSEQRGTEQDHHENVSEILKCDVEHGCLPFSNLHSYRCQARLFGSTQTLRRRAVLTAAIRRTQVVLLGLALGADGEGAEDAERERALERFVLAVSPVRRSECGVRCQDADSLSATRDSLPQFLCDFSHDEHAGAAQPLPGQPLAQTDEPEAKKTKLRCTDERDVCHQYELRMAEDFKPAISSVRLVLRQMGSIRPVNRRVDPTAKNLQDSRLLSVSVERLYCRIIARALLPSPPFLHDP